jgi:hypothetical protein
VDLFILVVLVLVAVEVADVALDHGSGRLLRWLRERKRIKYPWTDRNGT